MKLDLIEKALANSGDIGEIKPPPSIMEDSVEITEILSIAANYLLAFIAGFAVIAIIIAGIMWATAMGDDEKITKAKRLIKWSIIGLVIALSAYGIITLVAELFAPNMANI